MLAHRGEMSKNTDEASVNTGRFAVPTGSRSHDAPFRRSGAHTGYAVAIDDMQEETAVQPACYG